MWIDNFSLFTSNHDLCSCKLVTQQNLKEICPKWGNYRISWQTRPKEKKKKKMVEYNNVHLGKCSKKLQINETHSISNNYGKYASLVHLRVFNIFDHIPKHLNHIMLWCLCFCFQWVSLLSWYAWLCNFHLKAWNYFLCWSSPISLESSIKRTNNVSKFLWRYTSGYKYGR